jgi:hypothetical protein
MLSDCKKGRQCVQELIRFAGGGGAMYAGWVGLVLPCDTPLTKYQRLPLKVDICCLMSYQ